MDTPHTLLYLITGTGIGGAEKALCELVRRIDRNRYRVVVCSLKQPGAYSARLAAAADEFCHLGLSEAAGLRAVVNFFPALLRLGRGHAARATRYRALFSFQGVYDGPPGCMSVSGVGNYRSSAGQ